MLSWTGFEKLPGSAQANFEFLCRSEIRLNYGRYGQFAALANQPGVEFHLLLNADCALGTRGRWFGWQCRWYDLPSGKALGTTRRRQIEDSLGKTEKALPGLTDWVLWTRYPLTKDDQRWFYALTTKMQLALWTSHEAETLLSGEAEILRSTYFGELLLTPISLAQQHEQSVAQIRKRWLPEAHQTVDAERTLRRMLGEASSWDDIASAAQRLLAAIVVIKKEPQAFAGPLSSLTPGLVEAAQVFAETLQDVHRLLGNGDLELLRHELDTRPRAVSSDIVATSPAVARCKACLRVICNKCRG